MGVRWPRDVGRPWGRSGSDRRVHRGRSACWPSPAADGGAGRRQDRVAGGRRPSGQGVRDMRPVYCRGGVQGMAELRRRAAAAGCRGRPEARPSGFPGRRPWCWGVRTAWHLDPGRSRRPCCRCCGRWRAASRRWRSTNRDAEADSTAYSSSAGLPTPGSPATSSTDRADLAARELIRRTINLCPTRRIGPRYRMWALTMWSPRPAGGRLGDREIRHGTAPSRYRSGSTSTRGLA